MRSVKELVYGAGNRVRFLRAEDEQLWYAVEELCPSADSGYSEIFDFPIPFGDTAGAAFLDVDSPAFFMRWIRLRCEYWARVEAERAADATIADRMRCEHTGNPCGTDPMPPSCGCPTCCRWYEVTAP